jgi:hypothetical protein
MKYQLTRDDGAQLEVPGAVWETVLELAFRNGWKPAGTAEPRSSGWRRGAAAEGASPRESRAWPSGDYFSGQSQYVRPSDASSMSSAILRGLPSPEDASIDVDQRRRSGARGVAVFARSGGFIIGQAVVPEKR